MPKYLIEASYSVDGIKGVVAKGGSARKAAVQAAVEGLGGKLESFYFAFGGTDAYVVMDLPDNETAAALALAVASTGAVGNVRTIVLLAPEEIDTAVQKQVGYTPPGG
jgi:uncharacterized protein with GYD domain